MKKILFSIVVFALALALTAGAQDAGADCYALCKQKCISQQRPAEECAKACSAQCQTGAVQASEVQMIKPVAVAVMPVEPPKPVDAGSAAPFPEPNCACPACPVYAGCEMGCVGGYRQCVMKARSIAEPEEQKRQMLLCYEGVGSCIDSCAVTLTSSEKMEVRPINPPIGPVQVKPVQMVDNVALPPVIGPVNLVKGVLPAEGVPPVEQPPLVSVPPGEAPEREPSCEERCSRIKKDCDAAGIGKEACGIKIEGCIRACRFEQQPPRDCAAECRKAGEECIASGYDAESCGVKVDNCVNACPPRIVKVAPELPPAEPAQPEAKTGFFARILRAIGIG